MHGKLWAMVSGLVRFMLLHVPFCVHVFVCVCVCAHVWGDSLKEANILFLSVSEVSRSSWICDF